MFYTFPLGISLKVSVIVWLEFELTYYITVQQVNHNATQNFPHWLPSKGMHLTVIKLLHFLNSCLFLLLFQNLLPMIDFNGMSTHLELFYAYRLVNHVHCMFTFTSFVMLLRKRFCMQLYCFKYSYVIQIIILILVIC